MTKNVKTLEIESYCSSRWEDKEDQVDDFNAASSINRCETCVLIKTHELMFRQFEQKESTDYFLNRVHYDLVLLNEKYNENFWINYFIDFCIKMNFVYTHARKNDAFRWFEIFWKRLESNTIKSFHLYKWTTNVF
jgi:hypothetical protein